MNKFKDNDINDLPEIGALWEKDFNNLKFFGVAHVEEFEKLIEKAKRNDCSKINFIAYKVNKSEESNSPNFILKESKFNNKKK